MAKLPKIKVATQDAVKAAIVAFRINGNSVVRDVDGNNKQLIYQHFAGKAIAGFPDGELQAQADEIVNGLMQRVMMNTLAGRDSGGFLREVVEIITKDSISSDSFGLLAWAPKLYQDTVRADVTRETVLNKSADSSYIGVVGKKVSLEFTPLTCSYVKNYNMFVHVGHDGAGNLISFWNKQRFSHAVKITARVKNHRADPHYSNAKFTTLNYVKEVNQQ
jgi:hypothetical protein